MPKTKITNLLEKNQKKEIKMLGALIANGWFVWLFAILLVVSLVVAVYMIARGDRLEKLYALIPIAIAVILYFGWHFSASHRVVPPQERWIYVDKTSGLPIGGVRKSGLTEKPIFMYDKYSYPGAPEQYFCLNYFPALKEGYEIKLVMCGTYDASEMNWADQYVKHTFTGEGAMLSFWTAQTKEQVSAALKDISYTDISTDRMKVSDSLRDFLYPWFKANNIKVANLVMENWDFTSENVKAEVDKATGASMRTTVETQLLAAAEISRQRQEYEVETANLILASRGVALDELFKSLGITDDNAKAYLASNMTWYSYLQQPASGVQVFLSVGGTPLAASVSAPSLPDSSADSVPSDTNP